MWHTDRVPVLRVASGYAQTTAALARVVNDVLMMSRPEVGELREPTAEGRGVSSAMPQKQNPVLSVLLKRTALDAPHLLGQVNSGAAAAVDAEEERQDGRARGHRRRRLEDGTSCDAEPSKHAEAA